MLKRGEITTQQIVLLIILITSFLVVITLFFRLELGEESEKQICHNSVILKGKSLPGVGSLDCKTSYIEIDETSKNDILKTIADEMSDCWWVFGEGRINYIKGITGTYCAVCSTVTFSEGSAEVTYRDLFNYLEENKRSDTQSYLQYLFRASKQSSLTSEYTEFYDFNSPISNDKTYSIITGRSSSELPLIGELWDPNVMPVYFVENIKVKDLNCKDFITKA